MLSSWESNARAALTKVVPFYRRICRKLQGGTGGTINIQADMKSFQIDEGEDYVSTYRVTFQHSLASQIYQDPHDLISKIQGSAEADSQSWVGLDRDRFMAIINLNEATS